MLSRAAEAVYWMGRYVERAENVARFVEVNDHLMLDLPMEDPDTHWEPLVMTTGDQDLFYSLYHAATPRNTIEFLTFRAENPNSILSCLSRARENARSVREIISSEMWQQINALYLMVSGMDRQPVYNDPHPAFTRIKEASHLFNGITHATMSHGDAWHFLRTGQHLERADKTSRILDVKYYILLPEVDEVGTPFDNIQWSALLKSASALEMFRKRFGRIAPNHVADFLILDREFPRSIHYSLVAADESLHVVTGTPPGTFGNPAEQELGRLTSELDYTDIDEIIERGLHEFLDSLQTRLNTIDGSIHATFFALEPTGDGGS